MKKRFAVVLNNKITRICVAGDIDTLSKALGPTYEVYEINDKKFKVGESWSWFPTVRKIHKYFKKRGV
jgi:hypothetical protein